MPGDHVDRPLFVFVRDCFEDLVVLVGDFRGMHEMAALHLGDCELHLTDD
ncbi:MAG: hypothetical protein WDM88_02715 [Galbitalea sp.]